MNSSDQFGVFLLILLIIGGLFFLFKGKVKFGFSPRTMWMNPESSGGYKDLTNELIDYYHQVLTKYVDYYRKLNRPDRKKFIDRLHELIEQMQFQGRDGQEINLKVCALTCAPLIQITMGLETYTFNQFHTIVVYPRQFYSNTQMAYVKGGVSRGDAIFFSFEDLLKGFEIPNDSINLGLHEMAHAVHIEYFDEEFEEKFPHWENVAQQEILKMRGQMDPLLRRYAEQNKHELFAVCIETFFEEPNEMKLKSPRLYDAMVHLLNQQPL